MPIHTSDALLTERTWFTMFTDMDTRLLRLIYSQLRAVLAARGEF